MKSHFDFCVIENFDFACVSYLQVNFYDQIFASSFNFNCFICS